MKLVLVGSFGACDQLEIKSLSSRCPPTELCGLFKKTSPLPVACFRLADFSKMFGAQ
jgi:hypothetical protein